MTILIGPFNDNPPAPLQASQATVTSGSDTSGIDAFHQGVELTRDIYFYEGSFKIWSGDPNHQVIQHEFGQLRVPILDALQFAEQNHFDPVTFVSLHVSRSISGTLTTPPTVTEEGQSIDGAIEPLQVRPRIGFFSADAPPVPPIHIPRGELESGNASPLGYTDRVLTVDRVLGKSKFFVDRTPETSVVSASAILPDAPMVDTIDPFGLRTTPNMDSVFVNALRLMSSSSDTYVPSGSRSGVSGFACDTGAGTDSTAYCNLRYRPLPANIPDLSGLQWLLPITASYSFGATHAGCVPATTSSFTLSGDSHKIYNVTLRFRGVVEQKTYIGGTNDGAYFQIGGTPGVDNWNIFSLVVSNPAQTYYLNRGTSGMFTIFQFDYDHTIQIAGGATLTLAANSIDVSSVVNDTGTGGPLSVPGITKPGQPYDGQFIQMDVVAFS